MQSTHSFAYEIFVKGLSQQILLDCAQAWGLLGLHWLLMLP